MSKHTSLVSQIREKATQRRKEIADETAAAEKKRKEELRNQSLLLANRLKDRLWQAAEEGKFSAGIDVPYEFSHGEGLDSLMTALNAVGIYGGTGSIGSGDGVSYQFVYDVSEK